MKGITAIITVILLLLIAVVMVGFAFTFFQGIFDTTSASAEAQVQQTSNQLGKAIRIDSAAGVNAYIRNVGSVDILIGEVSVYDGATGVLIITCPAIPSGTIGLCDLTTNPCLTTEKIRATSPANSDTFICP